MSTNWQVSAMLREGCVANVPRDIGTLDSNVHTGVNNNIFNANGLSPGGSGYKTCTRI